MEILGAYMVPHPPLIVEEIGKEEIKKIKETYDSYVSIAEEIGKLQPETVIISSPHAPLYSDYFYLPKEEVAIGSFSKFGASEVKFNQNYDVELINEIENISKENSFPCGKVETKETLDHGTMVPLYFINKYLNNYNLVVVGLSGISLAANYEMGRIIYEAVKKLNRKVVYIASGDLSHKLQEYGPYGFIKEGPIYDEKIIDIMSSARFRELLDFDLNFLEKVAECGHRSFVMMSGFLRNIKVTPSFYSHEDVTGVGYGICSYHQFDPYIELAKNTINSYIKDREVIEVPKSLPNELTNSRSAAFVSIHKNGKLRGCIGTIFPTKSCVAEEIIRNAISAATEDPRFSPITADELDYLEISVDILSSPEEITDASMLDPKKYGVIVTSGYKRGLLLPNLDGIDQISDQIAIAKQKANISDNDEIKLQRFEVIRHEYF